MEMENRLLLLYARLKKEAERCKVYAMRAKKDGRSELTLLFQALSVSQNMQARRFFVQLRGSIGATAENTRTIFTEEIPGFLKEYGKLLQEAEQDGSKALETGFRQGSAVQQRNLDLQNMLKEQSRDPAYYVCDFCGYIAVDEPPDNCPVCTAPKKRFIKVDAGL